MSRPFFCICMPTFNRAHVIENAIESVIGQTFSDWRLVVIDNHSTDGTWELLNRKYGENSKIRLVRNDRNLGGNPNLDRCLEFADGEWLGILADDDLYRLHALETIHQNTVHRSDLILWTHGQFLQGNNTPSRALPVYDSIQEFRATDLASIFYTRGNIFGVLSSYFLRCDPLRSSGVTFSDGSVTVDINLYIRFLRKFPDQKAIYWPDLLTCADVGTGTASHMFTQSGEAQRDIFEHMGVLASLGWPRRILLWQLARLVKCHAKYRKILSCSPEARRAPFIAARQLLNALLHPQ